jgi:hypothetical protein
MRSASPLSVLFLAVGMVVPAAAQAPASARPEVRLTPGLVLQGGVFGDDDPEGAGAKPGIMGGVQVRFQPGYFLGFVFDGALQPVGIRNPHFDETMRSIHAQFGLEIGRRVYVRPSLGMALHFWSGTSAAPSPSKGLAAGFAIGRRKSVSGDGGVWPELALRASAEPGAGMWMIGLQVPIARKR